MSTWPKQVKYYLHSNKEDNFQKAAELSLSDESIKKFMYCCYEITLTLEVYEDGKAYMTHVEGIQLPTIVGVT